MNNSKIISFIKENNIYKITIKSEKTSPTYFFVNVNSEKQKIHIKINQFSLNIPIYHTIEISEKNDDIENIIKDICLKIFENYEIYKHKTKYTQKNSGKNKFLFPTEMFYPWIININNIYIELSQLEKTISLVEFKTNLHCNEKNILLKKTS